MFSKALSVVKKTKNPEKFFDDWKYLTYLVFDAYVRAAWLLRWPSPSPSASAVELMRTRMRCGVVCCRPEHGGTYEERVKFLKSKINAAKQTTYAAVVGISKCKSRAHLKEVLKEVLKKGGEGVMLRKPGSLYEHKRSNTLLKVKYFHDEEAKVVGRLPGTGRCSDMMGKLECVLPNGCKFKVGTGFSDAQRKNKKFCKVCHVMCVAVVCFVVVCMAWHGMADADGGVAWRCGVAVVWCGGVRLLADRLCDNVQVPGAVESRQPAVPCVPARAP
jgi:hypothetical protein